MSINIPFPRLLDSTTMQEVRRITPISASVNLSITPLSTATLVVDIDEDIPLRSYIEMYTAEGSAGIYRVREIQSEYGTRNIKTLNLEHAICELADHVAILTDTLEEENTVYGALNHIFQIMSLVPDFRCHWSLGSVASSDTVVEYLDTNSSDSLTWVLNIMEQIPDYVLEFDQSSLPWKLNVVDRPYSVTAEGRLSRNVKSAVVRMDDREWIDRMVAVTFKDQTIEGVTYRVLDKTFSANDDALIAQYGRVNRVETMEDGTSTNVGNRYVNRMLNKYKQFKVSVSIDAVSLARITGESLDSFKIGKKFRLAIDNFVKEENITEMSWSDVYNDPTSVSITLAEPPEKVTRIIHKTDKNKVSKKKRG